jgi:hypothetical protein
MNMAIDLIVLRREPPELVAGSGQLFDGMFLCRKFFG